MKRLANNWNLKLTALVLAVALWAHVKGQTNPLVTSTFKVNLRIDRGELPRKMIITDSSKIPQFVTVTLYGPKLTLQDFQGPDLPSPLQLPGDTASSVAKVLKASLDFGEVKRGEQNLPIKVDVQSSDVIVIAVKPSDVVVTLDQAAVQPFTVEPQFSPSLLSSFTVDNASASPSMVEVSGPSDALGRVAHVRARIRSLKAVSGSVRFPKVALVATTSDGDVVSNVQIDPDSATVAAVVHEIHESKSLKLKPRAFGNPATGYQLEQIDSTPDHLTVSGPPRALHALDSLPLPVDIEDAKTSFSRRVDVPLPADVTVSGGSTVTVRARIGPVPPQMESPGPGGNPAIAPPRELPVPAGQ